MNHESLDSSRSRVTGHLHKIQISSNPVSYKFTAMFQFIFICLDLFRPKLFLDEIPACFMKTTTEKVPLS